MTEYVKSKRGVKSLVFHLGLLAAVVVIIYPFLIMISGSFKTDLEMNRAPLRIFPQDGTVDNYRTLFISIPFVRQFFNSTLVAAAYAALSMLFCSLVAFGFTRFERFTGKKILFSLILTTMLIPSQVYMVPMFQMYRAFGFFGTYLPMLIPAFTNAFGIFLIRQVMDQVPRELYESAVIDGCGELYIYSRIAVPLSVSGLGILVVLNFMANWNDFMTPLIYLNKEAMYTLPIGLMRLQNFYKVTYGAPLAGAFISCIPVIILLTVVGQKYFIRGLIAGAVKG
ncbi:carbohydrate ABC transporter permease [Treponema sp. TIM-1]|uniref:carbohydrate ABC transporter permease n=1 Tax=Treponema sp. TIM-1 TaxID=2898417 RepID=UPI0039809924